MWLSNPHISLHIRAYWSVFDIRLKKHGTLYNSKGPMRRRTTLDGYTEWRVILCILPVPDTHSDARLRWTHILTSRRYVYSRCGFVDVVYLIDTSNKVLHICLCYKGQKYFNFKTNVLSNKLLHRMLAVDLTCIVRAKYRNTLISKQICLAINSYIEC